MREDLRSKRADNENQKYHLKDIQFSDLQPITGHPRNIEILAGKKFETNIVVTIPFSIICVSFQTPEFDIQIGLYRADEMSQYIVHNKDEENEEIVHCLEGNTPLQEVQGLRLVDATMPCKLNYIASEPGLYRIILSNEHSWYNSKQLLFRYCVLSPTHEQHQINI